MKASYSLNSHSIGDLLKLLVVERGESIRLKVGYQPVLMIKGQEFEVEGPVIFEEVMEELLRTVASTRQVRDLRERGTVEIIHTFQGSRFLVRAVQAFGEF